MSAAPQASPGLPEQLLTKRFVNCCNHPIRVILPGGKEFLDILPNGRCARINETRRRLETLLFKDASLTCEYPVPVYECDFDVEVRNLPEPEEGVYYIVSRLIAESLPDRRDLIFPDDSVRVKHSTTNGVVCGIIGCRSFAKATRSRVPVKRVQAQERNRYGKLIHYEHFEASD